MKHLCYRFASLFVLVPFLLVQTACATIVSSSDQDIRVISDPEGASVKVDGMPRGRTPLILDLERKRRHDIKIEKEGYEPAIKSTSRGFNWWFVGNLIIGGLIGIIIDFSTGAVYKVKPDEISAALEPIKGVESGKVEAVNPALTVTEVAAMDRTISQLEKLAELKDKGVLNQAEFEAKKQELLEGENKG